jgi:hypothetical protein
MQIVEKDAFWRAKVSNLMRGAVTDNGGTAAETAVLAGDCRQADE